MRIKSVSGNTKTGVLDERDDYQWILLKRSFMVCDRDDANSSASKFNLKTYFCNVHFDISLQFADMFANSGVFESCNNIIVVKCKFMWLPVQTAKFNALEFDI
jgi:hypothetical protein